VAFITLKNTLKNWPKAKRFKKFFQSQEALNVVNQYFKERKNWSLDIAKASSLNQGELTIKSCRAVISSELRLEESELRAYLKKRIPDVKIDKIFYKIG